MGEFAIIVSCLVLNAIFAAVEMAFVTVTKARLRELARGGRKGSREAQRILALREKPERTLSIIQIGITIVGALAAAVGGMGAAGTLSPYLSDRFGLGAESAQAIAVFLVVAPITYLSVVFGELVPKTLALRNPLRIVLAAGRWLVIFDQLFRPIVWILESSTRAVLALLGPRGYEKEEVSEAVELNHLSEKTREYVLNLVDLEKKLIRDVKLPWESVVYIREGMSADDVEKVVLESGHTRLPVLRRIGESVAGMINTKEFSVLRASGKMEWERLIRPVVQVEEGLPILRALRRMQDSRSHLSITYAGGARTGIVTVEDIFEEIIGDLYDEDDDGTIRRVLGATSRFRSWNSRPSPVR